jgi:hypothetical protein
MSVATAMPVVKANASAIAMNIFVMLIRRHRYQSDIMLNIRRFFLRDNTYCSLVNAAEGPSFTPLPWTSNLEDTPFKYLAAIKIKVTVATKRNPKAQYATYPSWPNAHDGVAPDQLFCNWVGGIQCAK